MINTKQHILLTGSNGYIAKGIVKKFSNSYKITTINRQILDLTDSSVVNTWFNTLPNDSFFDIVIHTAITGGNRTQKENSSVLDKNLKMYYNLLDNISKYTKFINIGSGAEDAAESFYGLSKRVIGSSISDKDNFYNLKIYGIFDENELARRFIKSNICRYLNKTNLVVHKNKYMDFIYFDDFISILSSYLENSKLPKSIDCVYEEKYSLLDIANIVNNLSDYSLDINILDEHNDKEYIGQYYNLNLKYIGLREGILETYRRIKNEKNMVCS